MQENKGIVISGGRINREQLLRFYRENADAMIVCVDGGCRVAHELNMPMDIMYGDFDTISNKEKETFRKLAKQIVELKPEKDVTDTHGALEHLVEVGMTEVVIFGGSGTRLDHSLANLMVAFGFVGILKITFLDDHNKIRFFKGKNTIQGSRNHYKYLSLIPVEETMVLETSGLKYQVGQKKFYPYTSLGISNEVIDNYSIETEYGTFMIVESND